MFNFLKRLWQKIFGGGGKPPQKVVALPLPAMQREIFLNQDRGLWMHTALSSATTDAAFQAMIDLKKANQNNVWWMYAWNEKDYGGGLPVSFYVDNKFGGTADPAKVAFMRARMERAIREGFAVVLWLVADDSPTSARAGVPTKVTHASRCVQHFDDLVSSYVIGLELQETHTLQAAQAVLAELTRIAPGKPVGGHEVAGKLEYAKALGYPIHYHQYGFKKTPEYIASMTRSVKAALPGRKVVAAEYHMSSTSPEARALGQAALKAGADGTGNGQ